VGALLVTSEAPPLAAGLAAALHARLGLPEQTPALEVGGACVGFLHALWLAGRLLPGVRTVLVLAVEDASRWLLPGPGPSGEAAALFGDGAGAWLLGDAPAGPAPRALAEVALGVALGVAGERVWSETARTGNLGSASIPVAWAAREAPAGPVAFAAAGAGLQWGSALLAPARD
jgi:3-oxoacyl-[acyl-carrier-protein] synthase III